MSSYANRYTEQNEVFGATILIPKTAIYVIFQLEHKHKADLWLYFSS